MLVVVVQPQVQQALMLRLMVVDGEALVELLMVDGGAMVELPGGVALLEFGVNGGVALLELVGDVTLLGLVEVTDQMMVN